MSVREFLSQKRVGSLAAAAALILTSAGVTAYNFWPEHIPTGEKSCYSDDDGQTWFVDSTYKVVPFDHDGKQAVRAGVYNYANGKKTFIVYLLRFNSRGQKLVADAISKAAANSTPLGSLDQMISTDKSIQEIKLPGAGHPWIPRSSPDAMKILSIQSPDGSTVDTVIP